MNESQRDSGGPSIDAFDTAAYIFDLSAQLAIMAEAQQFTKLSAVLMLARSVAAETLATLALDAQSGMRNAATEDAA